MLRGRERAEDISANNSGKKRKAASDAERMAVELSKINFIHSYNGSIKIEKTTVSFPESARQVKQSQCTWRDDKTNPCYCEKAILKFETYLPDRNYLARFSVQCPSCYDADTSAVHLYCAYCDEVLTGSIAGPGGKVSDHLVTIRHVYKQSLAIRNSLESERQDPSTLSQAADYCARLLEWSERVRYPIRTAVKRTHIDRVLDELHLLLDRAFATVRRPVRPTSASSPLVLAWSAAIALFRRCAP